METADGRGRARFRVEAEMTGLGWTNADLAREARIDAGTVGDFLGGSRWPKSVTKGRIARALGWTPESIDLIVRGDEPIRAETVSRPAEDAGVLLSLPPGALDDLSPTDREEAISAAKATLLERAREIRRRLDS